MKKLILTAALACLLPASAGALDDASIPTKIPTYWGASAAGGNITCPMPIPSQISISGGRASWTDGFPPLTFLPVSAGGIPPFGKDFNGALCQISQWVRWNNAGAPIPYDASFQSAISGYPRGSVLASASIVGLFWMSTADNNISDPDAGGADWISFANGLDTSAVAGATETITASQCGKNVARSNSGAVMLDTLPGTGTAVLPNGCSIRLTNADTAAFLLVKAATGASIKGHPAYNGYVPLGPGQSASFLSDGSNYWMSGQPDRAVLASGSFSTVYVSSTAGSDSVNHGLSSASPFLTCQFAVDFIQKFLDANNVAVTIQLADGTYTSGCGISGIGVGQNGQNSTSIIINGNSSTPSNVVIATSTADAIYVTNGANVTVQNFLVGASGSATNGISAHYGAHLVFSNMIFSNCANAQIYAETVGKIYSASNYTITGSANFHVKMEASGLFILSGSTVTVSGAPSFVTFAATLTLGSISVSGSSYSGSASGQRYSAVLNSVLATNGGGANFFPGNSAGTTATGGQYQ